MEKYTQNVKEEKVICTERSVNQYHRRDTVQPFELYSFSSTLTGCMPISPAKFSGHLSQKYKYMTFNHFASKILFVLDLQITVDKYMICRLFILFCQLKCMTRFIKGQSNVSLTLVSLNKQKMTKIRTISFYSLLLDL